MKQISSNNFPINTMLLILLLITSIQSIVPQFSHILSKMNHYKMFKWVMLFISCLIMLVISQKLNPEYKSTKNYERKNLIKNVFILVGYSLLLTGLFFCISRLNNYYVVFLFFIILVSFIINVHQNYKQNHVDALKTKRENISEQIQRVKSDIEILLYAKNNPKDALVVKKQSYLNVLQKDFNNVNSEIEKYSSNTSIVIANFVLNIVVVSFIVLGFIYSVVTSKNFDWKRLFNMKNPKKELPVIFAHVYNPQQSLIIVRKRY